MFTQTLCKDNNANFDVKFYRTKTLSCEYETDNKTLNDTYTLEAKSAFTFKGLIFISLKFS